jgi:hypothetical protein
MPDTKYTPEDLTPILMEAYLREVLYTKNRDSLASAQGLFEYALTEISALQTRLAEAEEQRDDLELQSSYDDLKIKQLTELLAIAEKSVGGIFEHVTRENGELVSREEYITYRELFEEAMIEQIRMGKMLERVRDGCAKMLKGIMGWLMIPEWIMRDFEKYDRGEDL